MATGGGEPAAMAGETAVARARGPRRRVECQRMAELISFVPTLCALSLVVFGLGGYQPTAPVVPWTISGAVMGCPVSVNPVGVVGWLGVVVAVNAACTAHASGRGRPVPHHYPRC